MGKNKKKSFYKKSVRPFISGNKVVLAALAGAATGIALVNVLGNEKAKQIADTIGDAVKDFSSKVKNEFSNQDAMNEPAKAHKKIPAV